MRWFTRAASTLATYLSRSDEHGALSIVDR